MADTFAEENDSSTAVGTAIADAYVETLVTEDENDHLEASTRELILEDPW